MHDNRTHPLLQQVPLTVSPFVNLPTATTLPYQYRPMPSTLPPSATTTTAAPEPINNPATSNTTAAEEPEDNKPRYVVSASGHAAHPDDIIASCQRLHAHVAQLQAQAHRDLQALTERIVARELAEKRRVAPGWLDSEARLLEPERAASSSSPAAGGAGAGTSGGAVVGGGLGVGVDVGVGQAGAGAQRREMLLQQPLHGVLVGGGMGQGEGYQNGFGHGPGGESEMAVPDEGEELDRAFGTLGLQKPQ